MKHFGWYIDSHAIENKKSSNTHTLLTSRFYKILIIYSRVVFKIGDTRLQAKPETDENMYEIQYLSKLLRSSYLLRKAFEATLLSAQQRYEVQVYEKGVSDVT